MYGANGLGTRSRHFQKVQRNAPAAHPLPSSELATKTMSPTSAGRSRGHRPGGVPDSDWEAVKQQYWQEEFEACAVLTSEEGRREEHSGEKWRGKERREAVSNDTASQVNKEKVCSDGNLYLFGSWRNQGRPAMREVSPYFFVM